MYSIVYTQCVLLYYYKPFFFHEKQRIEKKIDFVFLFVFFSLLRLSRLLAVRFYSHSVVHDAPLVRPFDEVPGPRGKFALPYIGTMLFTNSIGVCA